MTKIVTCLLVLICPLAFSQNSQIEINEQVWKPFIKTFSENDTEGFLAVHSKDLVRSPRDSKRVQNWDQYLEGNRKSNERDQAANRKRKIELRFTERIASADQALEVGIYRTSYINSDGTTRDFYGKFLVVLRKENNIWKILVDTDSSEGGTIDEKSFLAAQKMEQ